jgi:hypothetical protein
MFDFHPGGEAPLIYESEVEWWDVKVGGFFNPAKFLRDLMDADGLLNRLLIELILSGWRDKIVVRNVDGEDKTDLGILWNLCGDESYTSVSAGTVCGTGQNQTARLVLAFSFTVSVPLNDLVFNLTQHERMNSGPSCLGLWLTAKVLTLLIHSGRC